MGRIGKVSFSGFYVPYIAFFREEIPNMSQGTKQKQQFPERLLTIDQVATRLGLVRRTVNRHRAKLEAKGLQKVMIGPRTVRFLESSLNRMIKRAAERNEPLF